MPQGRRRFIPARAGNTIKRSCARAFQAVHPRAGGEHISQSTRLSPLTARAGGEHTATSLTGPECPVHPRAGGEHYRPMDSDDNLTTVHPRAGGEHAMLRRISLTSSGSSPRGRGTLQHVEVRSACRAVHPRAGGEHVSRSMATPSIVAGSSPRGRGTPANGRADWSRATVHPRAGGEHALDRERCLLPCLYGSSPRGRGTRARAARARTSRRFIPARAGNTATTSDPVHPRAGGEHPLTGSSPRGRGTHWIPRRVGPLNRFIPARAGNTSISLSSSPRRSVHPRAGGEHNDFLRARWVGYGSSPRGRGTRRPCSERPALHRFIPARAGNTPHTNKVVSVALRFIPARAGNTGNETENRLAKAVHPRAGGEHVALVALIVAAIGSSPRGRGTRGPFGDRLAGRRFIPARAGNTRPHERISR